MAEIILQLSWQYEVLLSSSWSECKENAFTVLAESTWRAVMSG